MKNKAFLKVITVEIFLIVSGIFLCILMHARLAKAAQVERPETDVMDKFFVEMPNGKLVAWKKAKHSKLIVRAKPKQDIYTARLQGRSHKLVKYDKTELKQLVADLAEEANFKDVKLLFRIIKCESGWKPQVVNRTTGDYGLWQINLRSNPEVPQPCALNPYCSTKWTIKEIKAGNLWKWEASRYCWSGSI